MAIIIAAEGEFEPRPMLRLADGAPQGADDYWTEQLGLAGERIRAAVRGVARIETPGAPFPFVGTACLLASRLAVTASYVGEALIKRAGELAPGQPLALLDFADAPPGADGAIAVSRVEMIHPYWKCAFLVLAESAAADRILPLSPPRTMKDLIGREIAVIGYAAEDPRNDPAVMARIFTGPPGIKRIMPGRVVAGNTSYAEDAVPMILHDASTSGGTAGAPLIDLADGNVLGLQYAGIYLQENRAVPAWELNRDPQWARLWDEIAEEPAQHAADLSARAMDVAPPLATACIFAHARLLGLVDLLIAAGFDGMDDVSTLLLGLPPELLATLPQPDSPRARLTACLTDLNRMTFRIGEEVPIHYVLFNASALRGSYDPGFKERIGPFLTDAAGWGK